jgi:hypothetical protein
MTAPRVQTLMTAPRVRTLAQSAEVPRTRACGLLTQAMRRARRSVGLPGSVDDPRAMRPPHECGRQTCARKDDRTLRRGHAASVAGERGEP